MKAITVGLVLLATIVVAAVVGQTPAANPIAAQFDDSTLFLSPIRQTPQEPSNRRVTGLTVPHHLLARDLIAQAFQFAARQKPRHVLVLSPDHFNLGDSNVSITSRDFATVFGLLRTDAGLVEKLKKLSFVHEQSFFYREHGVQAELPFIKYYFPDAKITVLALKVSITQNELDQLVERLKQILPRDTLIVQSTDFSHYLTPAEADTKDAETLVVLRSADPEQLLTLDQPDHMDSLAAQYIQMRLQKEFFKSEFSLLAHRNSQAYTAEKVVSSTSYIVQTYSHD